MNLLDLDLQKCIHCGLCLESCATYAVALEETEGPRGRLALMKAVAQERLPLEEAAPHLLRCLDCRACEAACPSGVPYGEIWETFRLRLERVMPAPAPVARWRRLLIRSLLPYPTRLRVLALLWRTAQALGLTRLAAWLAGLRPGLAVFAETAAAHRVQIPFTPHGVFSPYGEKRGTVALFRGCVQDAFYARANRATLEVLRHLGFEVHIPREQTCCGAVAYHTGDPEHARELARRNIQVLESGPWQAVVNHIGGCGAMLKEYPRLFAQDPHWEDRARRFSVMVEDATAFVARHWRPLPLKPIGPYRAVYVDSCHLRHVQGVKEPPRAILRRIPGLTLVELEHPDRCCGSAGVYSLTQPRMALDMLEAKLEDVARADPNLLVVANPGCALHLERGLWRKGWRLPVRYVLEVVAEALSTPGFS